MINPMIAEGQIRGGVDRDDSTMGRVGKDARADRRLLRPGRVKQRVDVRRQSIHSQMCHPGDLADPDRSLRPPYGTVGVTYFGRIGLQQVGADAGQLVAQYPGGTSDGTSRHYHAARGERAKAEGTDFGVAMAHGNPRRVDAELLRSDL
jgi:hypothetical protein